MTDKKSSESRRKLLKSLAVGSGAVVAGKALPESWSRPVVDSMVLPAHAQTSVCNAVDDVYDNDPGGEGFSVPAPGVLGNDSGPAPLAVASNTAPVSVQGGSVTSFNLNSDGSFDYIVDLPDTIFTFTYTTNCGATATVTVNHDIGFGASDRNIKSNFAPVNEEEILNKVARLPIETWNYTDRELGVRHIGPMAQDFYKSFAVGGSDKVINMVDANGVNLAAIKALNAKLEEKDIQIKSLEEKIENIMLQLEKFS